MHWKWEACQREISAGKSWWQCESSSARCWLGKMWIKKNLASNNGSWSQQRSV